MDTGDWLRVKDAWARGTATKEDFATFEQPDEQIISVAPDDPDDAEGGLLAPQGMDELLQAMKAEGFYLQMICVLGKNGELQSRKTYKVKKKFTDQWSAYNMRGAGMLYESDGAFGPWTPCEEVK